MPITFRPGTSDYDIYQSVCGITNEYRLPDAFDWDIIVDVGAHVGTFAKACVDRGAAKVLCFEPSPENYAALLENLADEIAIGRVVPHNKAVWRSDVNVAFLPLSQPEFDKQNNYVSWGTGNLLWPKDDPTPVACVSLDSILTHFSKVRLLKLDCERSEWPILYTSRKLDRVSELCGEYHEVARPAIPEWANVGNDFTIDALAPFLKAQGLTLETFQTWSGDENDGRGPFRLGFFWARR